MGVPTDLARSPMLLPLGHRPFRFLFIGQVVSNLGDWLDTLAVLTLVVYTWHDGPAALAALTLAWMIPSAILGPLAGVLADRWPRRGTMIACDLARAAIVLVLAWAPSLPILVGLLMARGVFSSLFSPSRQAAIRWTLPEDQLLAANALGRLSMNLTKVLGPAVGGVLVAATGPGPVFGVDALTFLVSAACLSRLPPLALRAGAEGDAVGASSGLRAELGAGLAAILRSRLLRLAIGAIVAEMVIVEINDTLSVLAFKAVGMNELLVGLALGGSGLGNVLGTLLIGQWGGRLRPLTTMGAGMLVVGAVEAALGLALVVGLRGTAVFWLPLLVCCGAGFAGIWVPYNYVLQRETPPHLVARVTATGEALSTVGGLAGPPVGAVLASGVGLGPVFGGTGLALGALGIALWLVRIPE